MKELKVLDQVNLFAYGTLMVPEIMAQVAGGGFSGTPAVLRGFSRYGVRGEEYPGVVADPGGLVEGVLYREVPPEAMSRLDLFEGDLYHRCSVRVQPHNGPEVAAMVYVIRAEHRQLLTATPWDFDRFLQNGRGVFEREYGGFGELEKS